MWLAVLVVVACWGCARRSDPPSGGTRRPGIELRQADDAAGRPTGCIDTPAIAGDHRSTGIQCGRARSPEAALQRGRVVDDAGGGLPGAGLEGVWVTIHVLADGPLTLDALPPARAQTQTGPQGSFSIPRSGAVEYVLVVRAEPGGPPLAARRIVAGAGAGDPPATTLIISRPVEP